MPTCPRPLLLFALLAALPAQDQALFDKLAWRCIGPFRGGRCAAVTGVPNQRDTYYFGSTGGGVWKTTDAGKTWECVSDKFFGGSIGAVAVAESDPATVYVGGGEVTVRGNVAHGSGMWKSTDAGKTWKASGLADSHHIPRVRVHPRNPDLVYAAVLGHLYAGNDERGVFRSKDGGKTWERVLCANRDAGAVDLCMDPANPRVLYASTWRVRRTPFCLESGGAGSGLWKSEDGGDTWQDLSANQGFPQGTLGIIGVSVSPARPERVYAIVEHADGGVFRSEDGGKTWARQSGDRNLRQRAWYYTRIVADPRDPDASYVLNVGFHKSTDGGKTWTQIGTPHGDNHDLWIAPDDPLRMIEANDGGANVSFDGGKSWSPQNNQPTAQFYRVTTDDEFPYRVYGAQQDNSTLRIRSRTRGFAIGERDWEVSAGGESGWLAPDPRNPEIVYGGSYGGYLQRLDHRTGFARTVNVWPDSPIGAGAEALRHRFQWNFPLFFSRHDPQLLFAAGEQLFATRYEGQKWESISPDLTRNDKSKQGPSGGPITRDNTGVEYYSTIFAACESATEAGTIWCGSDDGLVHVTRDGGKQWKNVTPKDLPEWARVNALEPHPGEKGGLYLAATCYQLGDFKPYLFRTTDYGQTWTRIVQGIASDHFTRVVRADPERKGLLYAGTEQGVYVSFDDGGTWKTLQNNLPIVPITDLAVKNGDLIAATQGRAFWILDDLTILQQCAELPSAPAVHLFQPRPCVRFDGGAGKSLTAGQNPPAGAVFHVYFQEAPKGEVALEIQDQGGNKIRRFVRKAEGKDAPKEAAAADAGAEPDELPKLEAGLNRLTWNLRYPGAKRVPGMVLWGGGLQGPRAVPGAYRAVLQAGGQSLTVPFHVIPDPRAKAKPADYQAQFEFLREARDKLSECHTAILAIRDLRAQLLEFAKRHPEHKPLLEAGKAIELQITAIEEALYQTKVQSPQDVLNHPIRLNNRLSQLAGMVANAEDRPTDQAVQVKTELCAAIDAELAKWQRIRQEDLAALNQQIQSAAVPRIVVK